MNDDLNDSDQISDSRQTEEGEAVTDSEGEEILPVGYSDDESENENEMPTEADLKFIAEDVEESENEQHKMVSRKRKKSKVEDIPEDLSDDELDLIQENIGNRKKLRNKVNAVAQMFEDDSEEDVDMPFDDLDEFVVRDDMDGEADDDEMRAEKLKRRKERMEFAKNLGNEFGISDSAWRDIEDLFADDEYAYALDLKAGEELEMLEGNEDAGDSEMVEMRVKKQNLTLKDVYEPSELKEKMMTAEDDLIRIEDIPERFQLAGHYIPSDSELTREANIIAMTFSKEKPQVGEKIMLTAIKAILKFYRQDCFEIPFIYRHRRDYFDNLLGLADLWRLVDLDLQYQLVEKKKKTLAKLIVDIASVDPTIENDETVRSLVEKIVTQDDINDTFSYIHLTYTLQVGELPATKLHRKRFKPAPWKVAYDDALMNNIGEYSKLFDINPAKYVASVTQQQNLHFPDDCTETPLAAAEAFISHAYPTPTSVLDAARLKIAQDIAVHPQFRAFIRRIFFSDSVVSVQPTEKGKTEVEQNHPYYPFIYLLNKPVHKFSDGQFLQILRAEADGLLTVSIRVEEESKLIADITKYICNDYVNELSELWNVERRKVAEYAARELLFPQAIKWLKERLGIMATDYIANRCQLVMESKIAMQGVKADDGYHQRVLALSCGDGNQNSPTYAVMLNDNGEVLETSRFDALTERNNSDDVGKLVSLIKQQTPGVVCVSGFKANTKIFLMKVLEETVWPRLSSILDIVPSLMLVDDEYARIYMNSRRGQTDFPEKDFPMLIRYCVSIGRYVQSPIMEYAGLVNHDEDIKAVRLDPLQHLLPGQKFLQSIERAFVNIVNQNGVDINLAVGYPHYSHTLQFVAGLGPRKAQAMLLKILRSGGKLESRSDLIQKNICTAKIFLNCASFIRIRELHFLTAGSTKRLDVLDDTRVHPEDYELARKMAADALDIEDAVLEDDEAPSHHVKELMETETDRLNYLMLDDYALELEKQLRAPKKICLYEIKNELMVPYSDLRKPFTPPTPEEMFFILSGESRETVHENAVVSVVITNIKEVLLIVQLGSGLEGIIHAKNLDGSNRDQLLSDTYHLHQALMACIISINYDRMSVELTARSHDVEQNLNQVRMDQYFDVDLQRQHNSEKKKAMKKQTVQKQAPRTVRHPYWKSVNFRKAEEYLATRPRGEIVVRPSGKGTDHISITWKVDEGIFQHIDAKEAEKMNEYSLGKKLTIENKVFTEVDQIIAEYIEPMTRRIAAITEHPKYQRKTLEAMEDYVTDQATILNRSAYGFIISPDIPGTFKLVYRHPNNRVHTDKIRVRPNGYEFRKLKFPDIEQLLAYFKRDEAKKATIKSSSSKSQKPRPK